MNRFSKNAGFSLIELLIVIAIIGVITVFAVPNYMKYTEKTRRSDAKDALLQAATLQEKWYLQFNQYTNNMNDLNGTTSIDGHYSLGVVIDSMSGTACASGECFTVTATAQGAQLGDTDCAVLTIDNLGRKRGTNDYCW